jgi:phage terminase small subunit
MSVDVATKSVANMLKRPEVKEYMAERVSELEAVAKLTKSKVVKHLAKLMVSGYCAPKSQISAAAQISKMMGYDAPTKMDMEVNGSIEHSGEIKVEFINAKNIKTL